MLWVIVISVAAVAILWRIAYEIDNLWSHAYETRQLHHRLEVELAQATNRSKRHIDSLVNISIRQSNMVAELEKQIRELNPGINP